MTFEQLKHKLSFAPFIIPPNWNFNFELVCNTSDHVVGVILRQRKQNKFYVIHYGRNVLKEVQVNYTTMEKEILGIVYAIEKFRPYIIGFKITLYTNHETIKYLMKK